MGNFTTVERPVSVHWAAMRLGFSERTIREWARTGFLPGQKLGVGQKLWGFLPSRLEEFKRITELPQPRRRGGKHVRH